ncbi:transferrin [Venturia canescens]|uniref:transferrin n=1 Tax=Venturia canescens TaxID=32260 RepID=UPI001C9C3F47|nr:transferrin [Venturia canescens]XP_043267586.1 transferrin [Venturia canescens]
MTMRETRPSRSCPFITSRGSVRLALASVCYLCVLLDNFANADKLRMCIVETVHTTKRVHKLCPKLKNEPSSEVECTVVNDRVSCLRRLVAGDAEFAILEPEDLVLAGANTEYDILVTHELRLFKNDTQRFSMVALVKSDIKSASDLMGKRFCHSGLESTDDSTRIFATYFQHWIIPRKCDPDMTLVEDEISSLASYFGPSCVPGPWTQDSTYDSYLKSKYKNLCALCNNPAGCYHGDKYHGREGALLCLTENQADVAWVRLEDALYHFKSLGLDETSYNYLCPDGSTRSMTTARPCVWIRKPWPVIVANRHNAERVARVIDAIGKTELSWQYDAIQLMQSYRVTPLSTETLPTPEDFIQRYAGFTTANYRSGCTPPRTIRWCVGSNIEDRKCRTMRDVAQAYGIGPPISCIQRSNRTACIEALRTGSLDIVVVTPEEEVEARLKGCTSLLRAITNKKQDVNVVAALVRNDSTYQTLQDLEGARACFTGFRSLGWNAFISAMVDDTKDVQWNCSDLRAVSNFFKDSCVYGIESAKPSVPSNLYSLCQKGQSEMNATAAGYACLKSGRADVSFVSLKNGLENNRGSSLSEDGNLRMLCIDRSGSSEESCLLTWSELASVMINENMTTLRREEIYSTLLEIDVIFGRSSPGPMPAFSLYGAYDTVPDVLFPERTQHLQKDANRIHLPRSYPEVVERMVIREKTYKYCSDASRPTRPWSGSTAAMIMSIVIISASAA